MKTLLSLLVVLVALTTTAQNMTVNVPNLKVYTNATVGGKIGVGTTVPQSPISLGKNSASPTQRIALYEEVAGTFFYGLGVAHPDTSYGLGLYGGTGGSSPTNDNWWVYLGNDNTVRSSKPVVVTNSAAGSVPLTINHASGATTNALTVNNAGTTVASIGPQGVVVASGYDSTAPVSVTETGGAYTVDLSSTNRTINYTATGAVTFAISSLSGTAVKNATINIKNAQATNCPITLPAGVNSLGIIGYNTAGKIGKLYFEYIPSFATNVSYIEGQ